MRVVILQVTESLGGSFLYYSFVRPKHLTWSILEPRAVEAFGEERVTVTEDAIRIDVLDLPWWEVESAFLELVRQEYGFVLLLGSSFFSRRLAAMIYPVFRRILSKKG